MQEIHMVIQSEMEDAYRKKMYPEAPRQPNESPPIAPQSPVKEAPILQETPEEDNEEQPPGDSKSSSSAQQVRVSFF